MSFDRKNPNSVDSSGPWCDLCGFGGTLDGCPNLPLAVFTAMDIHVHDGCLRSTLRSALRAGFVRGLNADRPYLFPTLKAPTCVKES